MLKITPVVAVITKIPVYDRSQKTQYVILCVNHNIPSIVQWDPKVSVLMARNRKTTSGQKQYITGASGGDFFRL